MPTELCLKEPTGREWDRHATFHPSLGHYVAWTLGDILVVSTLDQAEYPDGSGDIGPQWHVSISDRRGRRPKPHHVRRALRAFGMVGAEEDNHHPGRARQFWMPVDPARRVDCECKQTEAVVTESDGYTWTNPKPESGEACRGCEYQVVFGPACPVHAPTESARG